MPLFYEDSLGAKLAARWDDLGSSDDGLIEDPEALAAAEAQAARVDPMADCPEVAEWVAIYSSLQLSDFNTVAGMTAMNLTAPLDAAGIPCRWDPYPPSEMPSFRAGYGSVDRPFTLLVPEDRQSEALELLHLAPRIPNDETDPAAVDKRFWAAVWENRRTFLLLILALLFLPAALDLLGSLAHFVRYGHV